LTSLACSGCTAYSHIEQIDPFPNTELLDFFEKLSESFADLYSSVSQELELGRFFLLTGYVVSACADQGLAGAGETRRGLRHDRARAGT
jgi:hypothetical protein